MGKLWQQPASEDLLSSASTADSTEGSQPEGESWDEDCYLSGPDLQGSADAAVAGASLGKASTAPARFARACARSYVQSSQLLRGYREQHSFRRAATVFGGSKPSDTWDPLCRDVACLLSECGYLVLTGGGGGVMEAGNVGALAGGCRGTVAVRLAGLNEGKGCRDPRCLAITAPTLSIRKQLLTEEVDLMVFFPGGVGTMDELFAVESQRKLRQWQTERALAQYHVILVGSAFWRPLQAVLMALMGPEGGAPSSRGVDLVAGWAIVDSVEEIQRILEGLPAAGGTDVSGG